MGSEILASAPWLVAGGSLVNPTLGGADGGEVDNWGRSGGSEPDPSNRTWTWRPSHPAR